MLDVGDEVDFLLRSFHVICQFLESFRDAIEIEQRWYRLCFLDDVGEALAVESHVVDEHLVFAAQKDDGDWVTSLDLLADDFDLLDGAVEAACSFAAVIHTEGGIDSDDDSGPRFAGDPARCRVFPSWSGEGQYQQE